MYHSNVIRLSFKLAMGLPRTWTIKYSQISEDKYLSKKSFYIPLDSAASHLFVQTESGVFVPFVAKVGMKSVRYQVGHCVSLEGHWRGFQEVWRTSCTDPLRGALLITLQSTRQYGAKPSKYIDLLYQGYCGKDRSSLHNWHTQRNTLWLAG